MKNNTQSSEQGQALVLLVLSMVVLLGFTALAIDGGMVYSDRRHVQNAADAASLAGGGAAALYLDNHYVTYQNWDHCNNANISNSRLAAENAAVSRAADNSYLIDHDVSDKNGAEATCHEYDNGSWVEKYIDIQTLVTADTDTAFAHFVFSGALRNSVEAVARIRPRSPIVFGNAIVALREDCPNTNTGGVHFDGTSDVVVTGGGIFSNACMKATGNVGVDVTGGEITCTGDDCYQQSGGPSLSPAPSSGNVNLPPSSYVIPAPDCSAVPTRGTHSGSGTINPGRYDKIKINGGDVLTMNPGLYCLSGNFAATGGTISGNGVTLYFTDGGFYVSGGVEIFLNAPPARSCAYCPPALPGVLIYLAQGNDNNVTLLGTSDSQYMGTVFAPNGMIEAGGSSSELSEIHAQLIGDTVKVHGTTSVVVNFDGEENYQVPPRLELSK
jgi:hypothetical protein